MNKDLALRGAKTRSEILKVSVDVASAEGLTGLTIGRLADELSLSKSGLFSHFGSKEDLQLATIDAARRTFVAEVIAPAEDVDHGLPKLLALMSNWIRSVENTNCRGGCFFFAASAEMDDRPGRVRDFLAKLTRAWLELIEREAKLAVRLGELSEGCDTGLLVFQLHGFVQEGNWFRRLHSDDRAFAKAFRSIVQVLLMHATETGEGLIARSPAAVEFSNEARPVADVIS